MRVAVLTISDTGARGERTDLSGERCTNWVVRRGGQVVDRAIVADQSVDIVRQLLTWCDEGIADLVLTTGGTGLSARDVTPEATRAVIDVEAPGIAEGLRRDGTSATPMAVLSRGIAGVRGRTLIVNLPGSPSGVTSALTSLDPIVDHACDIVAGRPGGHAGYQQSSSVDDPAARKG